MRYGRLRQTSAFLLLTLGLAACAHEVESPKVTLDNIGPNLICSAQRVEPVLPVHLSGGGFAPMPTNVLKEPTLLVLPSVHLQKVQDLTGNSASGTDILFSGKPGESFAENVQWESRELLIVNMTDAVELEAGLYDVTVTNPDGEQDVREPLGIAIVDPPTIASVEPTPPALCTDQEPRSLVIVGQNLLRVGGTLPTVSLSGATETYDFVADQAEGCTAIPGTYADGTVELCTRISVPLAGQPELPAGTYDLKVTSPAPASCFSSEPVKVVIVPPPAATMVTRSQICVDQGVSTVVIDGGPFARVPNAQPTVSLTDASGNVTTYAPDLLEMCTLPTNAPAAFGAEICTRLTFSVPMGALAVGEYTLTITNPQPVGCTSEPTPFTVRPPAQVTSLLPSTVCTGGSTIIASGVGFFPEATAELRCTTPVLSTGTTVNAEGTELTITFGAGIGAGETCDIVVKNADGCEDRPTPHQTVTGTQGPILFNVDPYVVHNGSATQVLLNVTSIEPPFVVKMWPGGDASLAVELEATAVAGDTPKIVATIPAGTMPGDYSIAIEDQSGCAASLQGALTVTDNLTISTGTVSPTFGEVTEATPITIVLGATAPAGTPRAFLNPTGDLPAVQLDSVTTLDATTLTAVVPENTPAGTYDLVIVWPDGSVAVLGGAYTSVATKPRIEDVVPQSIVQQSGQTLTILGTSFSSPIVTLLCETGSGPRLLSATPGTPVCDANGCILTATVDASSLAPGDVCIVRVTNDDGAYDEFSAIGVANSSGNLSAPVAGPMLNTARRALTAAAVKATSASRFVYAIGGDNGNKPNALDSVEFAPVDVFGNMSDWQIAAEPLTTPRTFAASATIGRYIYVFGGNDGSGAVASGERALVLSPEEVPQIDNVDLCLSGAGIACFDMGTVAAGLEPGVYSYRIAALIDAADPQNLGGETLPSDPTILRLTTVAGLNAIVKIGWAPPEDSLGTALTGVIGYRIYRTPKDGVPGTDEVLLAEVGATTLEYIDDGSVPIGSIGPLPPGSTSAWQALPAMNIAREAAAGAAAPDPSAPDSSWYVYALLGRDGATAHAGYEYLPVTIAANGRQTVGMAWTVGTEAAAVGRSELGAWVVDSLISPDVVPGDTWVYLGAGLQADGATQDLRVEAGRVTAGGQLTAFADDATAGDVVEDFKTNRVGYGAIAAADRLFVFGGLSSAVERGARAAEIIAPAPALDSNAWNSESLTMTTPRYLMGSTIQSAFIFLIGGSTGSAVTRTTETVVW